METISERILLIVNNKCGGKNTELAKLTGSSEANIRNYIAGTQPKYDFLSKLVSILNINPDWLLTGRGLMLNSMSQQTTGVYTAAEPEEQHNKRPKEIALDNVFSLKTDHVVKGQIIPVYDMEAVAGLVPLFSDVYTQQVAETIETSLIPKCDGGLRIVGDSMYPLLKSGDVVFYKRITDIINNLVWGEMYLISFEMDGDEYVTVKYLQKGDEKDYIKLVSYNSHHSPIDIHLSRIRAMAFIKASLRINSIK